jgi:valyl-tRNA synthetase
MLARLATVVGAATRSFDEYDYARALERSEDFFWWYCDFYLELVKGRRYDAAPQAAASVSRALALSLSVFQRLFAPFLPFVSEEVWSWWQQGSVHHAPWPEAGELAAEAGLAQPGASGGDAGTTEAAREEMALAVAADVLREVRKAKSQSRRPMRAPVLRVVVRDSAERLRALELGAGDLMQAGAIEQLERVEDDEFAVELELAPEPSG